MATRWVIGNGDFPATVHQAWQIAHPEDLVTTIEVPQRRDHSFNLSVLDAHAPADGIMFVAIDSRFGNYKRMELMQAAMLRGFKLGTCVHPGAWVAPTATMGPNVYIGPHASVGDRCRVEYNTILEAGVHLGAGCRIRPSCWVDAGVHLAAGVDLGHNTIVRAGSCIAAQVKVGKNCDLGWPQAYAADIDAKTTFDPRYDEPIRVAG